jgi:hypothetical protein
MKKTIIVIIAALIVVGAGYAIYNLKNNPVQPSLGNTGEYQIAVGLPGVPAHLASSTSPLGNEIYVGKGNDKVTLFLQAQASSTTGSLRIKPQFSRDCETYYDWHGVATTTLLVATTTFEWFFPSDATTNTTTDAWTFTDVNTECMKFQIYQGTVGGVNGNARIYGEVYIN